MPYLQRQRIFITNKGQNMITFDQIKKLFAFETQGKYCLEIEFSVDGSDKFDNCWMGKLFDRKTKKDVYWFGLTADGNNAFNYPTFEEFVSAKVFDGASLSQIWEEVTVLTVDGCDPEDPYVADRMKKQMKSILITGAAGGMGRATVSLFEKSGWRVFALDRVAIEEKENITPIVADLTDEESVKNAFESVAKVTDKLDAIIHFAGVYMLDSLVEMSTDAYDRIFDINVRGVYLVNKHFLPLLDKGSRIVITTSELAPLDPLPFTGIYAITKAALDKYAYSLAMELQLLGISVSVLRAGAVETGMLGASTTALDRFCENTKLYSCNAKRFKGIVESVESRCVPPAKIAEKCTHILKKRHPKFAYAINRNPLLLMLNILPKRFQLWVIKQILR
jgi:NAD(P)-dependent dehydrogenase (short-subunit alcohol dehydrogenase family)